MNQWHKISARLSVLLKTFSSTPPYPTIHPPFLYMIYISSFILFQHPFLAIQILSECLTFNRRYTLQNKNVKKSTFRLYIVHCLLFNRHIFISKELKLNQCILSKKCDSQVRSEFEKYYSAIVHLICSWWFAIQNYLLSIFKMANIPLDSSIINIKHHSHEKPYIERTYVRISYIYGALHIWFVLVNIYSVNIEHREETFSNYSKYSCPLRANEENQCAKCCDVLLENSAERE